MREQGIPPNVVTYNSIIKDWCWLLVVLFVKVFSQPLHQTKLSQLPCDASECRLDRSKVFQWEGSLTPCFALCRWWYRDSWYLIAGTTGSSSKRHQLCLGYCRGQQDFSTESRDCCDFVRCQEMQREGVQPDAYTASILGAGRLTLLNLKAAILPGISRLF